MFLLACACMYEVRDYIHVNVIANFIHACTCQEKQDTSSRLPACERRRCAPSVQAPTLAMCSDLHRCDDNLWRRYRAERTGSLLTSRFCLLDGEMSADKTRYDSSSYRGRPSLTRATTPRSSTMLLQVALANGDDRLEINWRRYKDGHRF